MSGTDHTIAELAARLEARPALVLSGAGLSTESGIPDYRSPEALARAREPMRYQAFVADSAARQHYWARSHVGWSTMCRVEPNAGHHAVSELQKLGVVTGVLTQNVDGLHQRAGSSNVLELHGSLARVRCLNCRQPETMTSFQRRLRELNPGYARQAAQLNPDGDVELNREDTRGFRAASCLNCGGPLKTDVVFFGENVPKPVVEQAWQLLAGAESLLVLGSSLTVFSGYRFAERAHREGKAVLIINDGPTRADEFADLKLEGRLGTLLPELVRELRSRTVLRPHR